MNFLLLIIIVTSHQSISHTGNLRVHVPLVGSVDWCRDDERQALSQSEFGQRMTMTDHVTKEWKFKANRWHYIGLMLRCSDEVEVAAKLDGLFDGHSTTPASQSLISQGQSS